MGGTPITILSWLGCLILCMALSGPALAASDPLHDLEVHRAPFVREIAQLRHIGTPEGVESLERVELGGTHQWISIRGRNRNNPVMLFIHGGPGTPMMHLSWAFQNGWEDYFTVVQWDQRGAGKNAAAGSRRALAGTMTIEQITQDAEALIALLQKRFNKGKVVVLGFSFGSEIGIRVARQRPDLVSVYVGVGQAVGQEGERILYERTLELARYHHNETAVKELLSVAPYPALQGYSSETAVMTVRRWATEFDGGWYGQKDLRLLYTLPTLAPEYTNRDLRAWIGANTWVGEQMYRELFSDDLHSLGRDFEIPIVFILGRHDLDTPYEDAVNYFEWLNAPAKKLITFERSAHFVMLEEPGRFIVTLVQDVLPYTEGAAVYDKDVLDAKSNSAITPSPTH